MSDTLSLEEAAEKMKELGTKVGKGMNEMHVVDGGAKRSDKVPYYRIIPACALKRWAEALTEGHEKYSEGVFESNWKKGGEQFYAEAFDHVISHLYAWFTQRNDPTLAEMMDFQEEDHLGHALAGMGFLAYGEEMGFFANAEDPSVPQLVISTHDGEEILLPKRIADKFLGEPEVLSPDKLIEGMNEEPVEPPTNEPIPEVGKGPFSQWLDKGKKLIGS